ncbi:whirlin [Ischnura elegans]|uniref:whirlin n=1 Tax=Ischnura elegans TaxID=197161 RepID=UPI001ED87C84|nr:whirlin [Ischnura elegans]
MMALGSEDALPPLPPPLAASSAAPAATVTTPPTRLFGGGEGAVCAACGGGGGRAPCPYCGAAPPPFGHGAYYEAEDVSAPRGPSPPPRLQRGRRPPRPGDRPHHGSSPALPPWPSSPPGRARGGGGSRQRRAISPEEVLRLLGPGPRATSPPRPPRAREPPQWVPPADGVRTVTMDRPPDASGQGYGICVKGGKEVGGGVYISRVEPGSVAERAGLRPGDSILQANGTPFRGITHEEALKILRGMLSGSIAGKSDGYRINVKGDAKMLKSCRTLSMTVESNPQASAEATASLLQASHAIPRIPPPGGSSVGGGCRYSWVDRVGRPVSPPPPVGVPQPQGAPRSPPNRDGTIRKVELNIEPGQSLGLMIRGGAEYGLGVFVTGVDEGSAAERSGLKVGDQILEVNGVSFLSLSHDEAVHRLKHPRRMTLTVRDVGRVPHSSSAAGRFESSFGAFGDGVGAAPYHLQTTSDEEEMVIAPDDEEEEEEEQRLLLPWCASGLPSSAVDGSRLGCPSLQMVEEKARRVLRKSEYATLAYYMREYAARRMAIDAFLAVLLEMLSTPEKYTLLTELREVVALEDRARFDELVYRREAEGQRCRELRQMLMAGGPSNAAARSPRHHVQHPLVRRPSPHHATLRNAPEGHESSAAALAGPRPPDEYRTPTSDDSGVDVSGPPRVVPRGSPASIDRAALLSPESRSATWGGPCTAPPPLPLVPLAPPGGASARTGAGWASGVAATGREPLRPQQQGEMVMVRRRRHSLSGAECCADPSALGDASALPAEHVPLMGTAAALYHDDPNMCGYLDGIRSHLGDWTQRVKSWYWGRPPEASGGGGGGVFEGLPVGGDESTTGEETGAECGGEGRQGAAGRRPLIGAPNAGQDAASGQTGEYPDGDNAGNSSVVADQQGNLRITVRKTRPMLGIAIEGGANTKHPLPRIINIHEDGAAFEAGGLEVGQLILEVDGQKVEGLGHQEVARLIAESFARKSRPGIEFLVIEAKKSNLEPKPTALIFLET